MARWTRGAWIAAMAASVISSIVPAAAVGQGVGHRVFMRGQVVAMTAGVATVCVGRADGAKPGQILKVVRITQTPGPSKGVVPGFRRNDVGTIRIDAIADDHFARASVVRGRVAVHDLVELDRN